MKKKLKWIGLGLLGVILVAIIGFLVWTQLTYGPTEEARGYAAEATKVDNRLEFGQTDSEVGFILYPGAKVEKEAYAYYGTRLAEEGVFVAIPSLRLNLGIADIDAAETIIAAHPDIERWVVGGHSLGGSAASGFALEHEEQVEGVIFLASYPISTMADSNLRVLSVSGRLTVWPHRLISRRAVTTSRMKPSSIKSKTAITPTSGCMAHRTEITIARSAPKSNSTRRLTKLSSGSKKQRAHIMGHAVLTLVELMTDRGQ